MNSKVNGFLASLTQKLKVDGAVRTELGDFLIRTEKGIVGRNPKRRERQSTFQGSPFST